MLTTLMTLRLQVRFQCLIDRSDGGQRYSTAALMDPGLCDAGCLGGAAM